MQDTISMLESIGSNASLRYAAPARLAQAINSYEASDTIRQAILTANSALLRGSMGHANDAESTQVNQRAWCCVQSNQGPAFDEPEAFFGHQAH